MVEEEIKIKKIWRKINQEKVMYGIIIVLIVLLAVPTIFPNFFGGFNFNASNKKYSVDVISIGSSNGKYFDLGAIFDLLIKIENINVKEKTLDYNSNEAKKLIEKYKIEKIPALIALGKVDKLNLDKDIFRFAGDAAIFDKPVPYFDLITGKDGGFVDAIEIYDSSCLDCSSMSDVKAQLEKLGIKIKNYEKVEASSEKGKNLIKENSLSFIPDLLVSKEIEEYWWVFPGIKNSFSFGTYYFLKNPIAPYKDILSGKVKGKVTITYITDKGCVDCYDVTTLKDLFGSIGIYIDKEKEIDVDTSEGKSLLDSYDIKAVPTAILSKEIQDYNLKSILEKVGKFINDEFVLTELDSLKVKYNKIGQGG